MLMGKAGWKKNYNMQSKFCWLLMKLPKVHKKLVRPALYHYPYFFVRNNQKPRLVLDTFSKTSNSVLPSKVGSVESSNLVALVRVGSLHLRSSPTLGPKSSPNSGGNLFLFGLCLSSGPKNRPNFGEDHCFFDRHLYSVEQKLLNYRSHCDFSPLPWSVLILSKVMA